MRKKVGLPTKAFDRVLRDYRVAPEPEEDDNAALPMGNPDVATVPAPLAKLAELVLRTFNRQVVMGHHSAMACTLWSVATYGADKAFIFPPPAHYQSHQEMWQINPALHRLPLGTDAATYRQHLSLRTLPRH